MTHGSCNFAPPKDLEHVRDLLERKKRERERERERDFTLGRNPSAINTPTTSGPASPTTELAAEYGISEMDLREVEKEAERRFRPFACGVADCQRRYKNMNGLRYHYQHSGEHGTQGLALLASGQHECLQGTKRREHHNNQNSQQQQQQQQQQSAPQSQNQYATVEDREGNKRLVVRPMVPQTQSQVQQVQVQEQRNGLNAGAGVSAMVPVTVCDQPQSQQMSPIPQQPNMTQIHVTPVVVSPSVPQQGQQLQQSAALYAGQVGACTSSTEAFVDRYRSQYSPSHQQPNPYAYACYTPPTTSHTNVSQTASISGSPLSNSPGSQASTPITSPVSSNTYQQGYFAGPSNGYLGMSGMNFGLGLAHGGVSSLMGMQNGGYNQASQAQLEAFHQQMKDQYRGYTAQAQQQQQQQQQTQEGKESTTV
jgi:transcription factor SFP1